MWRRVNLARVMKRSLDTYLKDRASNSSSPSPPSPVLASRGSHKSARIASVKMPEIQLTPKEQQLRGLLLDVAAFIDSNNTTSTNQEPVVLRWAGGWVRDRLLGIESHDIDVAINSMTGVHFAQRIREYCDKPDAKAKHAIGPKDIGNLYNVASNPDKSKHLETAMVRMFGLDLDFVNLRRETYTDHSRNPQMEFGTAEEDALRRDATINALFYNLNTDSIEDFTGGVADMQERLIRTPMEPLQTFMDDPLRVLRLVRFASRLEFSIDKETEKFMGDERVLDALRVKISRERVGVELEKMLKGKHPLEALEFIRRLGLYRAIFSDPAQEPPSLPLLSRWPVAYLCLSHIIQNSTPGSIGDILIRGDDYFCWNLAAVAPWMPVEDPPGTHRKANALPPVGVVAREGFKATKKLTDVISAAHRNRLEILALKRAVDRDEPHVHERDTVGMAIRRWNTHGGWWRLQVLNAVLVDAMEQLQVWDSSTEQGKAQQEAFLRRWQAFLDHLSELDVLDAPSLKGLLDGRQLAKALGTKSGKWTGKALDVCTAWQLRNPKETDPAGAIEEVRKRSKELGIDSN